MLYQLSKMDTIWQVADIFDVSRGFLQNLISAAGSFTSLLVYFTAVSMNTKQKCFGVFVFLYMEFYIMGATLVEEIFEAI